MRVLVVVPTFDYKQAFPTFASMSEFPTGLSYIAAALQTAGHEVFGLNANNHPNCGSAHEMVEDLLSRSLREHEPELIALGGLCIDYKFIKDAISIIRAWCPDVPIVVGGGIIINDAEFVFKALRPDFSINGEAEETIVQLAALLEAGDKNYGQVPNLGYWKDGAATFTPINFKYANLDERSFPEYEIFGAREMLDDYALSSYLYWRYARPHPRVMPIVTARSCPFACTFCVHQRGATYRERSMDNIMAEVDQLYERYEFNILLVLDELFAVKRKRLQEFCEALIERKEKRGWDFDWWFQTHANAALTKEDLKLAKKSGLFLWTYGLESASPTVLKSMKKRSHISQIVEAVQISEELQIGYGGNLIFGDPAETPATIRESVDFLREHGVGHHIEMTHIRPYPGSKLFDDCFDSGLIGDRLDYYEHINDEIYNMTTMPDALWFPWVHALEEYAGQHKWEKSVMAYSCSEDPASADNPMTGGRGHSIWNIGMTCPWCSADNQLREVLEKPQETPAAQARGFKRYLSRIAYKFNCERRGNTPVLKSLWRVIAKVGKVARIKLELALRYKNHPLFDTLEPFNDHAELKRSPMSFLSACQSCGKRAHVSVPLPLPVPLPVQETQCVDDQRPWKTAWPISPEPSTTASPADPPARAVVTTRGPN